MGGLHPRRVTTWEQHELVYRRLKTSKCSPCWDSDITRQTVTIRSAGNLLSTMVLNCIKMLNRVASKNSILLPWINEKELANLLAKE